MFTELDFKLYEQVPRIWSNLIEKIVENGELNLTATLKELTKDFGPSELSVFKWADLLLKLDVKSPVFPVALIQYGKLFGQCPKIKYNETLGEKVNYKLLNGIEVYKEDSMTEKDPSLKRSYQNLGQ